jgi:D-alanyl-D-alanine carboxypeptidase (penicillin-binding protein 5/6)
MRKYFIIIILLSFLFLGAVSAHAKKVGDLEAKSYFVLNATTGSIIKGKNVDQPIQPASLMKVLSLYVIMASIQEKRIRLHDRVKISKKAWKTGGSQMFLEPETEVDLEELLKGMAIISANDAAVALAEHVGGDVPRFVERMNQEAALLLKEALRTTHTAADKSGLPLAGMLPEGSPLYQTP